MDMIILHKAWMHTVYRLEFMLRIAIMSHYIKLASL
jgi:hypothetical protein